MGYRPFRNCHGIVIWIDKNMTKLRHMQFVFQYFANETAYLKGEIKRLRDKLTQVIIWQDHAQPLSGK